MKSKKSWPRVRTVGIDGMLVSFAPHLKESANRAAIAFRSILEEERKEEKWQGLKETSTSLVSCYIRFDPFICSHQTLRKQLENLLKQQSRAKHALKRRLWHIPTVYGSSPDLQEVARVAGLTPAAAVRSFSSARVRVQTIGFAPGQPYLGALDAIWDIPRRRDLNPHVPEGALVVAIRQFVLFSAATKTGWYHIGQTAFSAFRPSEAEACVLRPGDEVCFEKVDSLDNLSPPNGGASCKVLP